MKKAILILSLLLTCTFSSNAQNVATLEETIKWIESYGIELIVKAVPYEYEIILDHAFFVVKTENNNPYLLLSISNPQKLYFYSQKLFFKDIKKVELAIENYIWFLSSGDNIIKKRKSGSGSGSEELSDTCWIKFKDNESAQRFFKALINLTSFYDLNIEFKDITALENKF